MSLKRETSMRQLLLVLVLLPSTVFAWDEVGHKTVCQIAYEELLPEARVELDRLIAIDPDFENFADSCLFADKPEVIRFQDHFINIPRSAMAVTTAVCPMADSCALIAIPKDASILSDPASSDAEKLLALKLLGHWVGDIHQPLHVSFMDDRGANSINVDLDMKYANFHSVWDHAIRSHNLGDDYSQIALRLRNQISDQQRMAWKYDSPIEWVNESFQITISPATKYCVQKQGACWYSETNLLLDEGEAWRNDSISDDYLRNNGPIISLRLQQAGVRLGQLLNLSLTNGKNNE
jgi:hypothetical protein